MGGRYGLGQCVDVFVCDGTLAVLFLAHHLSGQQGYVACLEAQDVQGRQMPRDTELQPGLYVVKADEIVKNIMVK